MIYKRKMKPTWTVWLKDAWVKYNTVLCLKCAEASPHARDLLSPTQTDVLSQKRRTQWDFFMVHLLCLFFRLGHGPFQCRCLPRADFSFISIFLHPLCVWVLLLLSSDFCLQSTWLRRAFLGLVRRKWPLAAEKENVKKLLDFHFYKDVLNSCWHCGSRPCKILGNHSTLCLFLLKILCVYF